MMRGCLSCCGHIEAARKNIPRKQAERSLNVSIIRAIGSKKDNRPMCIPKNKIPVQYWNGEDFVKAYRTVNNLSLLEMLNGNNKMPISVFNEPLITDSDRVVCTDNVIYCCVVTASVGDLQFFAHYNDESVKEFENHIKEFLERALVEETSEEVVLDNSISLQLGHVMCEEYMGPLQEKIKQEIDKVITKLKNESNHKIKIRISIEGGPFFVAKDGALKGFEPNTLFWELVALGESPFTEFGIR